MPDHIFNWFVNYYLGHSHSTIFKGAISDLIEISASVIQGSGLWPLSFLVNASDLHTVHEENKVIKFANYTNLIIFINTYTAADVETLHKKVLTRSL